MPRTWRIVGDVEEIGDGTVRIWIDGLGEAAISIDKIPGWLVEGDDRGFVVSVPWEQRYERDIKKLKFLEFESLPYGDLSDEELIAAIKDAGGEG